MTAKPTIAETIEKLRAEWDVISHGPCFPLDVNARFGKNRIDDAHGNVVVEQPDIWLPEAVEYLVNAGNAVPELLAEIDRLRRLDKLAMEWLKAEDKLRTTIPYDMGQHVIDAAYIARETYRASRSR